MKLSDAIAKRLRTLLDEREMTVYRLIKESGIPKATVRFILNSHNKGINLSTLLAITDTLHITLTKFFNDPLFDNLDITVD